MERISKRIAQLAEYREWIALARQQTGKGFLRQLMEITALKRAGGRCGITDYYWFRLYDETFQQGRGAPDFLGWRLEGPLNWALNPRQVVLPAWDKIVFIQLAAAAGLPVPPVRACYHRAKRLPEILGHHLRTPEEAAAYLRQAGNFPLFAKPAYSQQGYGATYLAAYDPATDTLRGVDGQDIPVETFVQRLTKSVDYRYHRPECGFLFQQPLKLAPEIETLTGWPAICSARVVCLNGPQGAKPVRAAWKIAVPPNHVDNFHMGEFGNLVADIDLKTGEIGRVVDGFWPRARLLTEHPVTGRTFKGFKLPGWRRVLEICAEAGAVFPMLKIQHWDFAFTDQGPVILELNDMGGTQIVQLHGHGLLNEEMREFLKRHADRKEHPWVASL